MFGHFTNELASRKVPFSNQSHQQLLILHMHFASAAILQRHFYPIKCCTVLLSEWLLTVDRSLVLYSHIPITKAIWKIWTASDEPDKRNPLSQFYFTSIKRKYWCPPFMGFKTNNAHNGLTLIFYLLLNYFNLKD